MELLEFIIALLYVIPIYIIITFCIVKWNKYEHFIINDCQRFSHSILTNNINSDNNLLNHPNHTNNEPHDNNQTIHSNNHLIDYNYKLLLTSVEYYEDIIGNITNQEFRLISSHLLKNKNNILNTYKHIIIKKDIISKLCYKFIIHNT